ncbi:MAG: hypothetical protein ABJ327_17050 [Litoreibacter sp.]
MTSSSSTALDWLDLSDQTVTVDQFFRQIGASVFRPLPAIPLVPQEEFEGLAQAASLMMSLQAKLASRIIKSEGQDALLRRLKCPEGWGRFVDWDKLADAAHRVARLDLVRTIDGPKFIEFNVFGGVGGPDVYTPYAEIIDGLAREDLSCGQSPFAHLADYYVHLIEKHSLNRIVLIDWEAHHAQGYPDFSTLKSYLEKRLPCVPISTHSELDYPSSWLGPGRGRGILVHRVFTAGDLGGDLSFLRAVWESGAHFASGLEDELCMDKGWLALFWEADASGNLSSHESAVLRTYLPETWFLNADSMETALSNKDELIFKLRGSYGGDGVFIGREWGSDQLKNVLLDRGPDNFITQTMLPSVSEMAPLDSHGPTIDIETVFGIYHYAGKSAGMMVRATRNARIVNAGTGAKIGWSAKYADIDII